MPLPQLSCSSVCVSVCLSVCLSVCYALFPRLFYSDRAFCPSVFFSCLLIKLSLKLGSLILEWDSNSVLEYAPILLYQFSKLPTKIGRSIFNLNHTKKRVSNCNFTSFFEFEFTVFFFVIRYYWFRNKIYSIICCFWR